MKTLIYLVVVFSLLMGGCKKKAQEHNPMAHTPEVLVNNPIHQDVVYAYEYPAYLEAIQTVNLVARVSGFLEKIQYAPGEFVKAGTLLFVIEPQPYLDQLEAARSQMKSAEANLSYAKAQYEKMKEAMPGRAISEIDFIQAESAYHSAMANLQNAKAQLNLAQTNLSYCYIRAPFDGHVSRNMVDAGNFVGGSVQPVTLATIYRDKVIYAYFNMAYAEFQNLPVLNSKPAANDTTMTISISDATEPQRKWQGKLDYKSPNVDLQTGTVAVRAIVDNPQGELLSGMYVKISVPYKQVNNALLIPEISIGTNQAGRYVYLVDKNEQVVLQPIKVGVLEPNGLREIISGATSDDRYVVEALMSVRPGMKVKPITQTAEKQPVAPKR